MVLLIVDIASGRLAGLELRPMPIRRRRLSRARRADAGWLGATLTRESARLDIGIESTDTGSLRCVP